MMEARCSDSRLRFPILSLRGGRGRENAGGISILCGGQEELSKVKDGRVRFGSQHRPCKNFSLERKVYTVLVTNQVYLINLKEVSPCHCKL